MIARVVSVSHARGRTVTVCGEIAGDERAAVVLVGLGVDALSVAPSRVRPVAMALSEKTIDDCRAAADLALSEPTP